MTSTSSTDIFQQVQNNTQQQQHQQHLTLQQESSMPSSSTSSPLFFDTKSGAAALANLSSFEFQQFAQGFQGGDLGTSAYQINDGRHLASGMNIVYPGGGLNATRPPQRGCHVCPHCGKTLSSSHGLRRHIDDRHTVHVQTYNCTVCDKQYRTPNSLQNHMYVYHKRKDCGQTVAT